MAVFVRERQQGYFRWDGRRAVGALRETGEAAMEQGGTIPGAMGPEKSSDEAQIDELSFSHEQGRGYNSYRCLQYTKQLRPGLHLRTGG